MPCMIRGGGIFGENDGGDLLQILEYSRICNVRILSVSFADSSPCAQGEPLDIRGFGLYQISREKSRKTEGVFLVGSRRSGGKSKSLRARFLLPAFSFGEAKENADRQSQISNTGSYIVMCIIDYKNSTDLPRDFQLSPLPAATSQALRASSPFRGALGAHLCQPRAPTYV